METFRDVKISKEQALSRSNDINICLLEPINHCLGRPKKNPNLVAFKSNFDTLGETESLTSAESADGDGQTRTS